MRRLKQWLVYLLIAAALVMLFGCTVRIPDAVNNDASGNDLHK